MPKRVGRKSYNPEVRKFLIAIVLLIGVVFIIGQFSEVQSIIDTLSNGDWRYLSIAVIVVSFWMLNNTISYWSIYRLLGLKESIPTLFKLSMSAFFVNIVAPTAGLGGMAVFVGQAQKQGYSSGRAAIAGALYVLFDYAGFLCLLALGIYILFRRNNLTWVEISASLILLIIACALGILLYLGTRSARSLGRALAWMAGWMNIGSRIVVKRDYFSQKRAYYFAQDAAEGLREIQSRPTYLLAPAAFALTKMLLLMLVFYLMFLAFNVPSSPGTIVAGFSISYLFTIVSPTPAGIGVVEGALTLGLRSLNVPLEQAAVIALAYRGISFWLPLLVGMLTFRRIGGDPKRIDTPPEYV